MWISKDDWYKLVNRVNDLERNLQNTQNDLNYYNIPGGLSYSLQIKDMWRFKFTDVKSVIGLILDKMGLELKRVEPSGPQVILSEKTTEKNNDQ